MTDIAAILHPKGEVNEACMAEGLEHCEACGYSFYGIVRDWEAAYDLLRAELVQVIVVANRETWAPRIEYAERRNQRTIASRGTTNARWRRARVVRHYR
jgi:hypothetical protein